MICKDPLGGRPHASDDSLEDGSDKRGKADRDEHESDAHGERGKHAAGEPVEDGRSERRKHDDQRAGRDEHPAGTPEIGDVVEKRDEPKRERPDHGARERIDQQHRGHHGAERDGALPAMPAQQRAIVRLSAGPPRRPDQQRRDPSPQIVDNVAGDRRRPSRSPLRFIAHQAHEPAPMKIVIATGRPVAILYPSTREPSA